MSETLTYGAKDAGIENESLQPNYRYLIDEFFYSNVAEATLTSNRWAQR